MNETLEPRQVEKPFLGRWVLTALALLVRSPASFGAAVAVLAVLELLCTYGLSGRLNDTGLTLVAGALLLPVFWILLSFLSRRADRAIDRSELGQPLSGRVWGSGLLPGWLLATPSWLLHWAFPTSVVVANAVGSLTWDCLFLVVPLGVCYFPLMALNPGLTVFEACRLSQQASRLNGPLPIITLVAALSLVADGFARAAPAGEIVSAAIVVFIGVFNYVAYLDIFERRADYAIELVLATRRRKALFPVRPRPSDGSRPPNGPRPPVGPRPPRGSWVDRCERSGSWRPGPAISDRRASSTKYPGLPASHGCWHRPPAE
jgi:hypothetical protein